MDDPDPFQHPAPLKLCHQFLEEVRWFMVLSCFFYVQFYNFDAKQKLPRNFTHIIALLLTHTRTAIHSAVSHFSRSNDDAATLGQDVGYRGSRPNAGCRHVTEKTHCYELKQRRFGKVIYTFT